MITLKKIQKIEILIILRDSYFVKVLLASRVHSHAGVKDTTVYMSYQHIGGEKYVHIFENENEKRKKKGRKIISSKRKEKNLRDENREW